MTAYSVATRRGFRSGQTPLLVEYSPVRRPERGSAAAQGVTWEHVTVCSFMPSSGPRLPCGVVVSTARVNDVFEKLFPNAVVRANKGGSATTAVFNELLPRCLALPVRERIPTKPIVCLLA